MCRLRANGKLQLGQLVQASGTTAEPSSYLPAPLHDQLSLATRDQLSKHLPVAQVTNNSNPAEQHTHGVLHATHPKTTPGMYTMQSHCMGCHCCLALPAWVAAPEVLGNALEGALDGFILAHVQGSNQLPDLGICGNNHTCVAT